MENVNALLRSYVRYGHTGLATLLAAAIDEGRVRDLVATWNENGFVEAAGKLKEAIQADDPDELDDDEELEELEELDDDAPDDLYAPELRDYFAAHALQAIISKLPLAGGGSSIQLTREEYDRRLRLTAEGAYGYADAMLRVRGAA